MFSKTSRKGIHPAQTLNFTFDLVFYFHRFIGSWTQTRAEAR